MIRLGRWMCVARRTLNQHVCFTKTTSSQSARYRTNLIPAYLAHWPMMQRHIPRAEQLAGHSTAKQTNQSSGNQIAPRWVNFRWYLPDRQSSKAITIVDYRLRAGRCRRDCHQSHSARRQIELMEEYRTRLIADVVTGKIDVRGKTPTRDIKGSTHDEQPLQIPARLDILIQLGYDMLRKTSFLEEEPEDNSWNPSIEGG